MAAPPGGWATGEMNAPVRPPFASPRQKMSTRETARRRAGVEAGLPAVPRTWNGCVPNPAGRRNTDQRTDCSGLLCIPGGDPLETRISQRRTTLGMPSGSGSSDARRATRRGHWLNRPDHLKSIQPPCIAWRLFNCKRSSWRRTVAQGPLHSHVHSRKDHTASHKHRPHAANSSPRSCPSTRPSPVRSPGQMPRSACMSK